MSFSHSRSSSVKKKEKDKRERKDHYTALGNSAKNEKTEAM